jgi:hypothetical protein
MSARINTNGQARKSLGEQIDRLDGMLDGLSEGLNEAVATAVKDAVGAAVQQAVQTVLREVLSSPELLARFQAAAPAVPSPVSPPVAPTPTPKGGWTQRWASVLKTLAAWVSATRSECGRRVDQVRSCIVGAWDRVRFLSRIPYLLLTALGLGMTLGFAASCTKSWWSAAVSGVGWLSTTAGLYVQAAWRRLTTLAAGALG